MKQRIFSVLKFLLGWPLSLLALFFLIKLVLPQLPQFVDHLSQVSPLLLGAGIVSFLVYFFLRGYIWKRLVKQAGYDMSYKDTNFIWAASELQRYIPGNIWSFLGRTLMLAEKGMTKKDIAKCTIFEMQFLIFGSAAVSLLALPFLVTHLNFPSYLSSLSYVGLTIILLFYAFNKKFTKKLFFLPDYPPVETLFLIALNACLFFFFGLGYFLTFTSFIFINPNLVWELTGISVLAYLVGYLSIITPSGIGVREGALVFALSKLMPVATAGFVALFGRFVLTIAEVIFVAFSYLWHKVKNKTFTKVETWIGKNTHIVILSLLFVTYVAYFTPITFLRYENLYTGKFDLGNMSQTVWNTTQGRIFTLTNPDTVENVSRLSIHADYILIFFAPIYAIWPDPRNLLFFQTAILASGAFFVYLIAKEVIKNKNLALVFAFAYLINPSIQRTNLYDFHAVTLATTFFLGAFYFFIKKRYWYFGVFAILAGICKEQLWLIVGLFGVFLAFWHKKYLAGAGIFIAGFLLSYYLISQAIPNASISESQHFALSYFSEFGDSPLAIVKNILLEPNQVLNILLQPERIDYLKQMLLPLGYLSLAGPLFLIFAGPDLTINLLSNNAQLHQIYYQYTATVTPFLFIAAIYGILYLKLVMLNPRGIFDSFQNLFKRSRRSLNGTETSRDPLGFGMTMDILFIVYLLCFSLYGAYTWGPIPGARSANLDMITKPVNDIKTIDQELWKIPPTASVTASNNIASHLSNRESLYILPLGIEKAEYVVFYLTESQPAESLAIDKKLVEKFKKDPKYNVIVEKGIFTIFKKI